MEVRIINEYGEQVFSKFNNIEDDVIEFRKLVLDIDNNNGYVEYKKIGVSKFKLIPLSTFELDSSDKLFIEGIEISSSTLKELQSDRHMESEMNDFVGLLQGEINFCKNSDNINDTNKESAEGFIKGLEKALQLYSSFIKSLGISNEVKIDSKKYLSKGKKK